VYYVLCSRLERSNYAVLHGDILLICGTQLYDNFISLRREVLAHMTSLIPSLFIYMLVPSFESERTWNCVLGVLWQTRNCVLEILWRTCNLNFNKNMAFEIFPVKYYRMHYLLLISYIKVNSQNSPLILTPNNGKLSSISNWRKSWLWVSFWILD
jgi:hypothetical protein